MNLFIDALQRYAANNKGRYPDRGTSGGTISAASGQEVYNFVLEYLDWPGQNAERGNNSFVDPSTGRGYIIRYVAHYPPNIETATISTNTINYSPKYRCMKPGATNSVYSSSAIAVWQKLESGGTNCIEIR